MSKKILVKQNNTDNSDKKAHELAWFITKYNNNKNRLLSGSRDNTVSNNIDNRNNHKRYSLNKNIFLIGQLCYNQIEGWPNKWENTKKVIL